MRELDNARRRAVMLRFSSLPIQDPAQHIMLMLIADGTEKGDLPSQKELASRMGLSPATVTATLKVLERHELITRRADENDLRINRVEATESGRRMASSCREQMEELETAMVRDFSPEELAQLSTLYARMTNNLKNLISQTEGGTCR